MRPIVQAMLVADHVYKDIHSGKIIVAGIFNRLSTFKKSEEDIPPPLSPAQEEGRRKLLPHEVSIVGSPWCYINLTGVRGKLALELRFVDLNDNTVLIEATLPEIEKNDPLENHEFIVQLPPLKTPHPGSYALELLTDNELIGSHRITSQEIQNQHDEKKDHD